MSDYIYFFTKTAVDDYHLAEEDLYFNVLNNAKTIYLYKDTVARYKKQILKGNVCMSEYINARLCYLYSRVILSRRFELGVEMISMHG